MSTTIRAMTMIVVAALASACGDLFHPTDWSSRCEDSPGASGCNGATPPEASGHDGTSSGSEDPELPAVPTSSAGPGGSDDAGGAGGTGGVGGAGGLGGAGGEEPGSNGDPCSTCSEVGGVVVDGSMSPAPDTLCPGPAQDAWDAVYACICQMHCANQCEDSGCDLKPASNTCQSCAVNNCLSELLACDNN